MAGESVDEVIKEVEKSDSRGVTSVEGGQPSQSPTKTASKRAKANLRSRTHWAKRKVLTGLSGPQARADELARAFRERGEIVKSLASRFDQAKSDALAVAGSIDRFVELAEGINSDEVCADPVKRAENAKNLQALRAEIEASSIYRAAKWGTYSFRIKETVGTHPEPEAECAAGSEARTTEQGVGEPEAPVAIKVKRQRARNTVGAWFNKAIAKLDRNFSGAAFEVPELAIRGPIHQGLYSETEGRFIGGEIVSAFSDRPWLAGDPVRLFAGVPGAGKTHGALEHLLAGKGSIVAYAQKPGARAQIVALADRLGAGDRVTVVADLESLEGAKRVLVDEAGDLHPSLIRCLMEADELAVSGDVGQSRLGPGQTLLGVLAALGAPMTVLTKPRRTAAPGIQLLSQFVSSTFSTSIPEVERAQFSEEVRLRWIDTGKEFDCLEQLRKVHDDMIVVVFDEALKADLLTAGYRAYFANEAQGAEADHSAVVFPELWLDSQMTKKVPYISMINGLCRARHSASLIMSSWGRQLTDLAFKDRERASNIEDIVSIVCADPRILRRSSSDFWSDTRLNAAMRIQSYLKGWYSVDRVGDALLVYKGDRATKYLGAFILQPALRTFSEQDYFDQGFKFAFAIEANDPIFLYETPNDKFREFMLPYREKIHEIVDGRK